MSLTTSNHCQVRTTNQDLTPNFPGLNCSFSLFAGCLLSRNRIRRKPLESDHRALGGVSGFSVGGSPCCSIPCLKMSSSPSLQNRLAPKQHRPRRHRMDSQSLCFRPTRHNHGIFFSRCPCPLRTVTVTSPSPAIRETQHSRRKPGSCSMDSLCNVQPSSHAPDSDGHIGTGALSIHSRVSAIRHVIDITRGAFPFSGTLQIARG